MKPTRWFVALLCLLAACAQVPNDPDSPDNPVWNPIDINGGEGHFVPPTVTITGGPEDGGSVPSDEVTFSWTCPPEIAESVVDYVWTLDDESGVTTEQTRSFDALAQTSHTFSVIARYPGGAQTPPELVPSVQFTSGPGFLPTVSVQPRELSLHVGEHFDVAIRMENFAHFEAEQVKGVHVVLDMPPGVYYGDRMEAQEFLSDGGAKVLGWAKVNGNRLTVDLARAGSPGSTSLGAGDLARLWFGTRADLAADSIRIAECVVRNSQNTTMPGVRTRGAKVEVVQ